MAIGVGRIETWSPGVMATTEADLERLGADAGRGMAWLVQHAGLNQARAARVQRLWNERNGGKNMRGNATPPTQHQATAPEVVSRWDQEPGAPAPRGVTAHTLEELERMYDDAFQARAWDEVESLGDRIKAARFARAAQRPTRPPASPLPEQAHLRDDATVTISAGFHKQPIPEDATAEEPIESVIHRATERFHREKTLAATRGPRRLTMPPGPYAIVHFGDPHLDDPGCDWPALLADVETVRATPGMYGGNLGDSVNNWVGRLVEQYSDQTITEDEGFRLAEWLFKSVPWLYVMHGNHDLWRSGSKILQRIADTNDCKIGVMQADDIRLELESPGDVVVRVHVRHDFRGGSQWSRTHALKRAATFDGWADVYVAGHRHVAEVRQEEADDGRFRTLLRARGYKRIDSYARSLGYYEQKHGAAITTVVDPGQSHEAERIRAFWCVQEAAEFLTWLRRRRAAA